jgi:hypothetical protein
MDTWAARRAQARHLLASCDSKDEMVDILLNLGFGRDPLRPRFVYPTTKRKKEVNSRFRRAWGIEQFYQRRKAA